MLGPIGPVSPSTSFVGNELTSLLGDNLLAWGELYPDMLNGSLAYSKKFERCVLLRSFVPLGSLWDV